MRLSRSPFSGLLAVLAAFFAVEASLAQNGRPPAPIIRTPITIGKGKNPLGITSSTPVVASNAFPTAVPPPPPPPSPFKAAQGTETSPTQAEAAAQKLPAGNVSIGFQEADLPDLVNWIGSITGRRFIYGSKVRQIKVSLYSPQPVSVAEAYRAFLVALESNGLTVIPHGRFLKIVDSAGVATQDTPIYSPGQPVPAEDRFITRLYRLQHIGVDEVSQLLGKFKSKEGDISTYAPGNLLIITDTGSNIRRMLRIVEEIDVGKAGDQLWVEPVHYGTASDMEKRLSDIFDIKPGAGGKAPGGSSRATKIIADDRTNSLIIISTEDVYLRILEVIKRLDVPMSGEGEIHVLPLQHAMAEELAPVLNQIIGGTGGTTGAARQAGRAAPAGGAAGQMPQGILEGGVRINADKATNSVIITASLRDYAQIRQVIDKLDRPRRQVFIEAVIMDISVDHSNKMGLNFHAGAAPDLGGSSNSLMYGGFNPLSTILLPQPDQLQGLALGVRGPGLDGTSNLLGTGLSVPAFGLVLNALATSGDANVLATPHIIATDNVAAEINVGENIPLQTNLGGVSSLGGLGGQAAGALGALGGLGMLGGLGGYGAAPRQDVGTKIKVTPHMNDSNEIRLELQEEISERGASSGALGVVSITKRNANTSVVVQDQQTVVIGGLMRDSYSTSRRKIPVLGDIPLLGALFRQTETSKRKTNLLLILTPYVIRDQNDLRMVFERKMQERQEFLDRYFVFSDQTPYEPPKDFTRLNGLLEEIRQTFLEMDERRRLAESTKPREKKTHEPSRPLPMPDIVSDGGGATAAPAAAPAAAPTPARPIRITPGIRTAPRRTE